MNWTIGKRMFFMGLGIVVALILLVGASYFTSSKVQTETKHAQIRNEQLKTTYNMRERTVSLLLAAMDSMVRKNEGAVNKENMSQIDRDTEFFKSKLPELAELADTEAEKKWVANTEKYVTKLIQFVQVDLVQLIEESGVELQKIENDFKAIDNRIDEMGTPIENGLKTLLASVQKKQTLANQASILSYEQIALLNDLQQANAGLMLAAMDAIVDKDAGSIEESHLQVINEGITFFRTNLPRLESLAETGEEKSAAREIVETLPGLARSVTVDLPDLIRKKGSDYEFERIDDTLDQYGSRIERNLAMLFNSVRERQQQTARTAVLRNRQTALVNEFLIAQDRKSVV